MFFFGAIEQQREDIGTVVPANLYNELEFLVRATAAGQLPPGFVNPDHPRIGEQPGGLLTYSFKGTAQLNNAHSLMFRYAGQHENRDSVTWTLNNDDGQPDDFTIDAYSAVGQHSWVLGNNGLNQITGQVNHVDYLADVWSRATRRALHAGLPHRRHLRASPDLSAVNTGAGGDAGTLADRYVSTSSRTMCRCSAAITRFKFGVNFNRLYHLGILNGNEHYATLTFFDDPSVIFNNTNGRYPQGFRTPGIVRQWQQANGGAINGQRLLGGYPATRASVLDMVPGRLARDVATDAEPRRSLRRRFEPDGRGPLRDQRHAAGARSDRHPYGGYPKTPKLDISPRVGFAYDLRVTAGASCAAATASTSTSTTRRGRGRHHLTGAAAAERTRDVDEHGHRRRPARHVPARHRPAAAAAHRGQQAPARVAGSVDRRRHGRSPHPPGACRLRARADGEHDGVRRLHARRGAQRKAPDEHQSDHQRPAPAGQRFPAGVWRRQLPLRREDPGGHQQVAVRRADRPVQAPHAADDGAGALHAGGRLLVRRLDREPFRRGSGRRIGTSRLPTANGDRTVPTNATGSCSRASSRRRMECSCLPWCSGPAHGPTT